MARTIAALIARGGSKRLPRKNVRDFCGLPLVAWTIIQTQSSRLIDEVWLSTDDDEIADIGRDFGAHVVRRPDWPDPDLISGQRPTRHALEAAMEVGPVDCFVGALVTTPLRKPDDLDRLVAKFYVSDAPVVISVIPRREMNFREFVGEDTRAAIFDKSYRYCEVMGGNGANNPQWFLDSCRTMTDESDAVLDAGGKAAAEAGAGPLLPYVAFEVWQQGDTDTIEEFELAEVKMEHYILKGRGRHVYDEYADPYRDLVGNWRQL